MKLKFMGIPSIDETARYIDAVRFDIETMLDKQVVLYDNGSNIQIRHSEHTDDPVPIIEVDYKPEERGYAYAAIHGELAYFILSLQKGNNNAGPEQSGDGREAAQERS